MTPDTTNDKATADQPEPEVASPPADPTRALVEDIRGLEEAN